MTTIIIGGDICATGINERPFADGDPRQLFGSLADRLQSADLVMANLESPLFSTPRGIRKSGPILGVPEKCIAGLLAGNVALVGLANNHAMDHSVEGLLNTQRACEKAGIATVGAGRNLAEARRIHTRSISGIRIGVLAVAEREFGLAARNKPGVNPLDPIDFVRNVRERANDYDYLIVVLHGGNEHLRYPRPSLVETCRFFIEEGANIVLCQHSHCIGCVEQYRNSHIVYGQGNFIFESPDAPDSWREGLLVCLELDGGPAARVELVPVGQRPGIPGAYPLEGKERQSVLDGVRERSRVLADPDAIEKQWDEFCRERKSHYLRRLGARSRMARGIDRLTQNIQRDYARSWPLRAEHLNLLRCESHRETLVRILSEDFE